MQQFEFQLSEDDDRLGEAFQDLNVVFFLIKACSFLLENLAFVSVYNHWKAGKLSN